LGVQQVEGHFYGDGFILVALTSNLADLRFRQIAFAHQFLLEFPNVEILEDDLVPEDSVFHREELDH